MVCKDAQESLHGYMDGELDPLGTREVERHLEGCEACSEVYGRQQTLRSLMRDPSLKFKAPAGLQRTIETALRSSVPRDGRRRWTRWLPRWQWAAVAACVGSLALVIWIAGLVARPSGQDLLAREVVASHVRSLMAGHLTDVPTSDQHTVKPWFNGRLDFSPPVKDLTAQGFTLVGGRLDYLGERPAAALIYRRRQHVINLFIWPAADRAVTTGEQSRRGYNLIHWTRSGMAYAAVSDLNLGELREFVRSVSE